MSFCTYKSSFHVCRNTSLMSMAIDDSPCTRMHEIILNDVRCNFASECLSEKNVSSAKFILWGFIIPIIALGTGIISVRYVASNVSFFNSRRNEENIWLGSILFVHIVFLHTHLAFHQSAISASVRLRDVRYLFIEIYNSARGQSASSYFCRTWKRCYETTSQRVSSESELLCRINASAPSLPQSATSLMKSTISTQRVLVADPAACFSIKKYSHVHGTFAGCLREKC